MTTEKDILKCARELISKPGAWTQNVLAKDEEGQSCDVYSDEATSFCLMGAITRAVKKLNANYDIGNRACHILERELDTCSMEDWQDKAGRRHKTVIKRLDKAIKSCP